MRMELFLSLAVFTAATHAAETIVSEDVEVPAEGLPITVASGDVAKYMGVLYGTGQIKKSGAGMLVLAANNTFSGGMMIEAGQVRVDCAGALGTGKVECKGGTLYFNAPAATFGNVLELINNSAEFLRFQADTTLTGTVYSGYNNDNEVRVENSATVIFEGPVRGRSQSDSSRGFVLDNVDGTIKFKGNVTMPSLHNWNGTTTAKSDSTIELWSPNNNFTGSSIRHIDFSGLDYVCCNTNVIKNAILRRNLNRDYRSELNMNGFDQEIAGFAYNTGDIAWSGNIGGSITSATPAKLTVKGSGANVTNVCNFSVNGAVSIVLAADPSYVLKMYVRKNLMTGDFDIRSGMLNVTGTDTASHFKNVQSISVGANGAFLLNSSGSSSMTGVKTISVEGGGSFAVASPASSPFASKQIKLSLGEGSSFALPPDTGLKVREFWYKGRMMDSGTYGHSDIPEIAEGTTVKAMGGGFIVHIR